MKLLKIHSINRTKHYVFLLTKHLEAIIVKNKNKNPRSNQFISTNQFSQKHQKPAIQREKPPPSQNTPKTPRKTGLAHKCNPLTPSDFGPATIKCSPRSDEEGVHPFSSYSSLGVAPPLSKNPPPTQTEAPHPHQGATQHPSPSPTPEAPPQRHEHRRILTNQR